jgi:hypothetical protein
LHVVDEQLLNIYHIDDDYKILKYDDDNGYKEVFAHIDPKDCGSDKYDNTDFILEPEKYFKNKKYDKRRFELYCKIKKAIDEEFNECYISTRILGYFNEFWNAVRFWITYYEDETKKEDIKLVSDFIKSNLYGHGSDKFIEICEAYKKNPQKRKLNKITRKSHFKSIE